MAPQLPSIARPGGKVKTPGRRYDIARELPRTWVRKYETGEFVQGELPEADRRTYEAKIANLERKVVQLTMELDLLKRELARSLQSRGLGEHRTSCL